VKQVLLPEMPEDMQRSGPAYESLRRKLQDTIADFVAEVEVGCSLSHPNLVRVLGYATRPSLLIVQELQTGRSVDKQLYVESWVRGAFPEFSCGRCD
jgi:hypothetical protein